MMTWSTHSTAHRKSVDTNNYSLCWAKSITIIFNVHKMLAFIDADRQTRPQHTFPKHVNTEWHNKQAMATLNQRGAQKFAES